MIDVLQELKKIAIRIICGKCFITFIILIFDVNKIFTIVYLDSPATTSTRHYGLLAHVNNGTATLNPNAGSSPEDCHTITLQEIAQ